MLTNRDAAGGTISIDWVLMFWMSLDCFDVAVGSDGETVFGITELITSPSFGGIY